MRLLAVDDDPVILDLLPIIFRQADLTDMVTADSSASALQILENQSRPFECILLDIEMPGMTGIELCTKIRQMPQYRHTPILMLTSVTDNTRIERAFAAGADDYITKPFSPRELVARLKAVLRRTTPPGVETPIEVDGLTLDPVGHRVTTETGALNIGPTEYRLLQFFMTHQERVYTRSQLLDQVWGGNVYVEERTVDVHIRRLRKALGDQYDHLIQTVRGTGYRFSTRAA